MTVAAFIPGLMDQSRFGQNSVTFVSTPAEVTESGAVLLLVDLDRCDDPAAFRITGVRVVGFGSHVDADRLAAAEALGYDEVLPRSVFFRRLPEILSSP